jgi:hypothetical protein
VNRHLEKRLDQQLMERLEYKLRRIELIWLMLLREQIWAGRESSLELKCIDY